MNYSTFNQADSQFRFKSPFNVSGALYVNNINSIYVSVWIKMFGSTETMQGTFLRCRESNPAANNFVDFGIYPQDDSTNYLKLQVMNYSYGVSDIQKL